MPRPGVYRPDATEGIEQIDDLPGLNYSQQHRNRKYAPCPYCRRRCRRQRTLTRTLRDLVNTKTGRPIEIEFLCSVHRCSECQQYFTIDLSDIAAPGSLYTQRVVEKAVQCVVDDGSPYREASWRLWRDHRVFVPFATIQKWVVAAGKKTCERIETDDYFDWAFKNFSGYIAVDEVYDGHFCILLFVDNRTYKRLLYRVLPLDPTLRDRTKMQKTVYRVRTCEHLRQRLSLDMFRDLHLPLHRQKIQTLHQARAG